MPYEAARQYNALRGREAIQCPTRPRGNTMPYEAARQYNALRGREANTMSDEANQILNGARKMPGEANWSWLIEYKEFY